MALKQIVVELLADTRKLDQGFKRIEGQTNRLGAAFGRLGAIVAGAFSVRALFQQYKGTLLDAEHILDTARAVGVTADEFERLSFVIEKRLGASAGTTEMMFKGLQQRLGKGGKEIQKALGAAGLNAKDLKGMSSADQALAVITALSGIESATQRASIAATLLGRGVAFQIQKVATAGAAAIQDANDDFTRIGSALGKSGAADAIGNLTDETDNLSRSWQVLKQQIVVDTAPSITKAIQAIVDSGVIGDLSKQISQLIENTKREIGFISDFLDRLDLHGKGVVTRREENFASFRRLGHDFSERGVPGLVEGLRNFRWSTAGYGPRRTDFDPKLQKWTGELDVRITAEGDIPANRRISKAFGAELDKRVRTGQ